MTKDHSRIMVVDDKPDMVTTLAAVLEDEGYDVTGVDDGYRAIELAGKSPFPLIFMDVKMPGINGLDTFREIKKISPDSVVVMMTGFSVEELVKDALEEGAYTVIYKPFDVGQILDLVQAVLNHCLVLVADDRALDRENLRAILDDAGYEVSTAENGVQAIAMATARHYRLILMDLRMPGMDWIAVLEEIRKIAPAARGIIISGYLLENSVREPLVRGAYTVLNTPVEPEELLNLVGSIVGREPQL